MLSALLLLPLRVMDFIPDTRRLALAWALKLAGDTVEATSIDQYILPYEEILIQLRKHPAMIIYPVILAIADGIALTIIGVGLVPAGTIAISVSGAAFALLLLYVLGAVFVWGRILVIATDSRVIVFRKLSGRTRIKSIPFADLISLNHKRTPLARLLGYGTFFFEMSGSGRRKWRVSYVPYPEQIYLEVLGVMLPTEV